MKKNLRIISIVLQLIYSCPMIILTGFAIIAYAPYVIPSGCIRVDPWAFVGILILFVLSIALIVLLIIRKNMAIKIAIIILNFLCAVVYFALTFDRITYRLIEMLILIIPTLVPIIIIVLTALSIQRKKDNVTN